MLWLLFTTGACNLRCSYCGGSFEPHVVPWRITYENNKLKQLIERDEDATVIFYGGEPLLNPGFIIWTMNNVKARRFGIQTNGTLVSLLPRDYWRRMDVVLLSIDGREKVTDTNRGRGVYRAVFNAFNYLRSIGVKRIIARMTVTELTDIYEDVTHLLNIGFNYVHWQLNVVWTDKWNIKTWADGNYLPGIRKLVDLFLRRAEEGKVFGIVPILGILNAYLFKPYEGPPCGAGYRAVAVSTDGRVLACPIAVREDWSVLGHINTGFKLMNIQLPEMCMKCEYKPYCGGRCLYAIMEGEKYWGRDGVLAVDYVTRETIKAVLSIAPRIKELINNGVIKTEDIAYDPILDSTEVIP
ncbi:Radical SAM domain protein [Vulcanisaeta moutnovskia 768-28]|uniref:Radical SAM domain protein n=1 Tax=Vulcanisaeta moutnovskia (strain 768-28) TaxID=985053 RepID=F0QST4_VULM7|nr:TIGR04084 family radical SAM/SPASM domain-containing protein [Vulcanisaeta moutnovskia]ADY00355.1 Radical SAM domain protein [Vulcanisaeta moutnovskia 768-28]